MNSFRIFTQRVLLLFLSLILIGCFSKEPARFVEGTESSNLAKMVTGYLIVNQGWDSADPYPPRILAISFPDLKQTIVRQRPTRVWSMSGPDNEGRIAFVEGNEKNHQLKTIYLDGSREELIFMRPGDTSYSDNVIGENLAISPTGGLIAFTGKGSHDQNPGALLTLGPIEIWDITKKTGHDTGIIAIDDKLWWSPNGKELAYVALVKREHIYNGDTLPGSPYGEKYEKEYGKWNKYPVVYIIDIETNQRRILHTGWDPVFSSDWEKALVADGDEGYLVDIKTGQSQPFNYPSASWNMPLFLLPNNIAIFRTLPTAGTSPRWLKRGSFKVGTLMYSVKLGEIDTWKFQTVLPYDDFRDKLSFGIVKENFRPDY